MIDLSDSDRGSEAIDAENCDLLVIGSGAAGLTAAVTAAIHGLKVVLVEKAPVSETGTI